MTSLRSTVRFLCGRSQWLACQLACDLGEPVPLPNYRKYTNGRPVWWERDDHLDLDVYGPPVDHGHETCHHRNYRLTCGEYERLLRRAGGRCEICGRPDRENAKGKLHIDHDYEWGPWAVRGLLCHDCNSRERFPWMAQKRSPYIANAWYVERLAELGVPLARPTEPPMGSRIADHRGLLWIHCKTGWVLQWKTRSPTTKTWGGLLYKYGPHNLHVVRKAAAEEPPF